METALREFKPEALDQALRLFEGEHLERSEKFVAPLRWLRQLHRDLGWKPRRSRRGGNPLSFHVLLDPLKRSTASTGSKVGGGPKDTAPIASSNIPALKSE